MTDLNDTPHIPTDAEIATLVGRAKAMRTRAIRSWVRDAALSLWAVFTPSAKAGTKTKAAHV